MIPRPSCRVCSKTLREDLIALLKGELARPRAWALQMHLSRCATCSDEWQFLQALTAAAQDLREAPAAEDLLSRGRAAGVLAARHLRRKRMPWRLALAVAVLGAVGAGGIAVAPAVREFGAISAVPAPLAAEEQAYQEYCARPLPVPNAYDNYRTAMAKVHASWNPDAPALAIYSDAERGLQLPTDAAQVVARNKEALALVEKARGEECRVPDTQAPPRAASAQGSGRVVSNPQTLTRRDLAGDLAGLIDLRGRLAAAHADYRQAAASGMDLVSFGRDVRERSAFYGSPFAMFVKRPRGDSRTWDHGFRSVSLGLEHLSASDCAQLLERARRIVRTWPTAGDVVFALRRTNEGWPHPFTFIAADEVRPRQLARWLFNEERTRQLEQSYYDAMHREYSNPTPDHRTPSVFVRPSVLMGLRESLEACVSDSEIGRARAKCLYAALAVRAYRLRSGHLPKSLDQAGVSAEDAADPFGGGPIHYEVKGDRFAVYSEGPGRRTGGAPRIALDPDVERAWSDEGLWLSGATLPREDKQATGGKPTN